MLQKLRREFVVITMSLVGLVLVVALGSALVSSYMNQSNMVYSALTHGLTGDLDFKPRFGDQGDGHGPNWLTLSADVSEDGTIIATSSYYIDPDVLTQIIAEVLSSSQDSGHDAALHLSWMRMQNETGWRISIVDTQYVDAALARQTVTDVVIVLAAMAALFVIVWILSSWIMKPIQKSWDSQRRFVSDASHELKTPLAVILANTQILLDDKHVPPDTRTWIESTNDEATHMKALVEDLLMLARTDEAQADGAKRVLAMEDVDLSELVDECAIEFDGVAYERGCSIESDIAPGIHIQADRTQLARAVRSELTGAMYVLDEPSIGLHPANVDGLLGVMRDLKAQGNTVVVVDHDTRVLRDTDWIIEMGPGAGSHGGTVIAQGTVSDIEGNPHSLIAPFLASERLQIVRPQTPANKVFDEGALEIKTAPLHTVHALDARVPKHRLTVVTGVSGSGKSTLVNTILYPVLADKLNGARIVPGKHTRVEGLDQCDKVIHVDQNPIGRTPRSNPATYTGVWDKIRTLFAKTPEAQVRGYGPGRFSFNVKGGRCEACHGDGTLKIEMNFLPDVYVECEECHGKRYNRETLEVKYNGKTVADVLDMPIEEAATFFKAYPSISRYLDTLVQVGLGYIRLGQPAPTLSGGESQRVKLATELQRRSTGKTVYILDEPTTGLHFEDVRKLLLVLQGLVDKGNTVIVIEHNLDVVKSADWIIDLGPEGGDGGGTIVTQGTPEQVAQCEASWTGKFLKDML